MTWLRTWTMTWLPMWTMRWQFMWQWWRHDHIHNSELGLNWANYFTDSFFIPLIQQY
jgi:hypothetical protein